jgi:nucleotide-binding universal stress UspA family protein
MEIAMKTVLLYATEDNGMESRLQAALDVARAFESHLDCVQVTPFDAIIMGDPFGGVYALPNVVAAVQDAEDDHKARIEQRLQTEGASWDWLRYTGQPSQVVVDCSRLADLIVLSLPGEDGSYSGPQAIAADVALTARAPVLAVGRETRSVNCFGPAMIAWNGSQEAANALRLTLPLLQKASAIHIVSVAEAKEGVLPPTNASQYLSRHGLASEVHEWPANERSVAESLQDAAATLGAAYVVMGAYGHSRFSEAVYGGVTRGLLRHSPVPLLLAH